MTASKSVEDFAAIVVGSGAGGAASAWRLCQRGYRVLILEAGPAYDFATDYALHQSEWEQRYFPAKLEVRQRQSAAPLQPLPERYAQLRSWNHLRGGFVQGDRRVFGRYDHVVGLGGSTLHFTGEAHRLLPASMQMHSRFGVAADWPLSYAQLEPYYDIAEHIIGVAGPTADVRQPGRKPPPLPAHALSFASQQLLRGAKKLKLDWQANHLAALSEPYDGRPGCNYCANCGRGCPRGDKGSADVTFIAKALASGRCTVRTQTKVQRLHTSSDGRISGVEYVDQAGSVHIISAPVVVLACGAVETPRLLLNSRSAAARDGVANESGEVGRNFMETLSWYSSGLYPTALGSHRGLPSDSICWDFNAPDAIPDVVGGCRFAPHMAEADLVGPLNYAERVVGGWGKAHQQAMQQQFGRVLAVGAIGEHLPNEHSYIDLDPELTDGDGIALARIHSHLSEMDMARLEFMAKTCRALLAASGVTELFEEAGTFDIFHATHVFGTCRMGTDHRRTVVDPSCRSHHWKNLYITDASVFPSSGGGEAPSLTIQAVAIHAADRIIEAFA